jgi:hypothetical protein
MKKKKLPEIEIQELILIKCGKSRHTTYLGTFTRENDETGNPVVRGSAVIDEGKAWSMASSEEELGNNLDEICWMKIEMGLHQYSGASIEIAGSGFNLN